MIHVITSNRDNALFESFEKAAKYFDFGEFQALFLLVVSIIIVCLDPSRQFNLAPIRQTFTGDSFIYIRIFSLASTYFSRLALRENIHQLLIFSSLSLNGG